LYKKNLSLSLNPLVLNPLGLKVLHLHVLSSRFDVFYSKNKLFTEKLPSSEELQDKISMGRNPYLEFIEQARNRAQDLLANNSDAYVEKHHIIPKFDGGSDDSSNLVMLTFNDHTLAHYIRWVVYKQNQDLTAFNLMSGQSEDARVERARLGGQIGGPKAQQQHKERQRGWFDSAGQRVRGLRGAAVNREQGTGAYDPANLERANAVQKENPSLYRDQKLTNLAQGRKTQVQKGVGIGDSYSQRAKSLRRFEYLELNGQVYSINAEGKHKLVLSNTESIFVKQLLIITSPTRRKNLLKRKSKKCNKAKK